MPGLADASEKQLVVQGSILSSLTRYFNDDAHKLYLLLIILFTNVVMIIYFVWLFDKLYTILFYLNRVLRHLGCPHGCSDAQRGPPADFLRSQVHSLLSRLHKASGRHFLKFFRNMVASQSIAEIIDFFHAFTGFCHDPGSLLSPLSM